MQRRAYRIYNNMRISTLMPYVKKIRLGQILLEKNLITQKQLDAAMIEQMASGKKLGNVLIEMQFIKEESLLKLLSEQLSIPYIDLRNFSFNPELVKMIPESYARRFHCLVLQKDDNGILVGMSDPQDVLAYDEISSQVKQSVHVALVRDADLQKILDVAYRHSAEISNLAEKLATQMGESEYDISELTSGLSSADTPVAKLLQTIFEDAVQVGASDIHIEPGDKIVRIRHRVDGLLHEQVLKEAHVADPLALRLKLMAHLNIAEKRIPQDGRFSIKIKNKNFDVRLSTMPTMYGESVVMRLLNQSAELLSLDLLGMPADMLAKLHRILTMPNGLLLITGVTGSGKTTTLYSILNELNLEDTKIITVEDPIEYRLPRITQVQVEPKIDLTFARVLRATLRQDPDIIMVGELRDHETAEIAIRSAMTGHFVLSTLHTNDAVTSTVRLLDMGIEGYLIASVLRAVISQRLVRRICLNCSADHSVSSQEEAWLISITGELKSGVTFKEGEGCAYCHQTGYKGQIALFELLEMNTALSNALRLSKTLDFVQLVKEQKDFKSLVFSGLELAVSGVTTISEVMRISGDVQFDNNIEKVAL